ncbi:hypothetical protein ACLOJK_002726 [Asimina triloba]
MASVRRLVRPLSLYSPIPHFIPREGTGAVVSRRRCFSTSRLCEDRESKYDPEADDGAPASTELEKIRHEFDAAKRSFLNIPATLKEMPKMNPEGIYVNKNLRLDTLQVYGFDYDYTLAHYSPHLQSLLYDIAKKHLVNEFQHGGFLSLAFSACMPVMVKKLPSGAEDILGGIKKSVVMAGLLALERWAMA